MLAFGPENAQSLVGVAVVLLVCWAVSENRKRFPWKLALLVLRMKKKRAAEATTN